jgi:hypothetical protein
MGVSLEKQETKCTIYAAAFLPCHAFVFNDVNFCVFLPPLNYLENCATDRISVRNNQPAKRQRMWNSETVKGSNPQMSTVRPATAPKGESNALKRNLSWSDSSAINDAPKERIGKLTFILLGV